jgi:hypothetical protein
MRYCVLQGESMPIAELPATAVHQGVVIIDGIECNHYIQDDVTSIVDIYSDVDTGMPQRATETFVMNTGERVPMITYELHNVTLGPQVCLDVNVILYDAVLQLTIVQTSAEQCYAARIHRANAYTI